ncbi:MAG: nucleotidyltransferase [Ignavibacteria bacterium]|nr:nucleotidyltransferase [Ignavibacteria bacterium]
MTIQDLKNKGMLIFEGIVGSQAYGTSTPTSDIDKKGVYIQPLEDIMGFGYIEQISDEKNDQVYYEVRRFLELISTNNPNIIELLNLPEEMITYKHPIYDLILENKDKFISKICRHSFAGYAIAQIKKARGLNKKIVNPIEKERKNPLDFAYVHFGYNSIPLIKYLEDNSLNQKFCGIANIPHARDLYGLFYDFNAHNRFIGNAFSNMLFLQDGKIKKRPFKPGEWNELKNKCLQGGQFLNYKGIVKESENGSFPSNELRMSHIEKSERNNMLCYFTYNKDGYTQYCKDYKEYWEWVEKRNQSRYNDNAKHGKGYDSKNMMHCHRLLDMAIEIGEGKGIIVRRPNIEYLLSIRNGEMDYDFLVSDAERKIELIDNLFDQSNLPEYVDKQFVNELLIKIRKEFYKL